MLDDIYEQVRERGLVKNRSAFSRQFLGRAHNYASAKRTREQPSQNTLLHLVRSLAQAGANDIAERILQTLLEPV
ncbi:DUF6626 family protein [Bosea minatitlanensis]|uniref:DUF6626 family protein n=1 Tax=Bosea minatitlanensis TaxID=128782 RepID=A0ABW0F9L7_9HYPH|nr:DUF6626 family protein [Bosea minatitlanensis]MCT4495660.1 hypothetical protein [Bosea minatitlanensis]